MEMSGFCHNMVCRHRQQYSVRLSYQRCQSQCWRCVSATWFQYHFGVTHSCIVQLLCRQKPVFVVAHNGGGYPRNRSSHTLETESSILQHGNPIAMESKKLFGIGLAREGPKACTRATA